MDDLLNKKQPRYTGEVHPKPDEINPKTGQRRLPYLPDEDLIQVVNWAIKLKRPLLLKGEPGCGKTQLAQAVAYELKLPFEAWYIKSTSSAQDGLYTYDNVARLRDAQLAALKQLSDKPEEEYVKWGALGRAFLNQERTVVLIDEIDKADLDFPNDLLLELDENRLIVEEVTPDYRWQNIAVQGREIRAKASPIVFITSNDEKELPDAFLRRCLFHYVEFPSAERLKKILLFHFDGADKEVIEQAVQRFIQLRKKMEVDKGKTRKKVSTSELLDWFTLVNSEPKVEILPKLQNQELPFAGILLKSRQDLQRYG